MNRTKSNLIILTILVCATAVFRFAGFGFVFSVLTGAVVATLNNIVMNFSLLRIIDKSGKVFLKYFLEMLFIRLPLIALLLYISLVVVKANVIGLGLGLALGLTFGMYNLTKTSCTPETKNVNS